MKERADRGTSTQPHDVAPDLVARGYDHITEYYEQKVESE